MNVENINRLADMLEQRAFPDGAGFDMGSWFDPRGGHGYTHRGRHTCGTVACIAGWAWVLAGRGGDVFSSASDWLDITHQEALKLFAPISGGDATPEQAARVLRHLATTGMVDWKVAPEAAAP